MNGNSNDWAGESIEVAGDGNVIGDNSSSQVVKIEGGGTVNHVTQVGGDYYERYYEAPPTPAVSSLFVPPKTYHRLVGRFDELDEVMNGLRDPGRRPMVAIIGLGGIGKTALVREAVDLCYREDLFDYVVWTSAKTERFVGEGTVKTGVSDYSFDLLLEDIGRQCKLENISQMMPDEKRIAVKSVLADRRVLVVMDNLETVLEGEELIDGLFQILGRGKLLITSRHRVKHEQVFIIELRGFSPEEGNMFLREESKARGIEIVAQAGRESLVEIHQVTGGAPLVMKLVIGQMSRQPMDMVLDELKKARFAGQDYAFYRFVFEHSWDMLGLDAKKVLVGMSVFPPGTGGEEDAVKEVSQVEEPAFWSALDQLVLMSLVDPLGDLERRRYAIHQLTHYFILSDIVKKWG